MAVASAIRVRFEPLRSLAFGAISGTYAGMGLPLANPSRIVKVSNFTDANILVSINGVDDHDIVAANGFYLYDLGTNKSDAGGLFEEPQGDRIYVKAEDALPTEGNIYFTTIYASAV